MYLFLEITLNCLPIDTLNLPLKNNAANPNAATFEVVYINEAVFNINVVPDKKPLAVEALPFDSKISF